MVNIPPIKMVMTDGKLGSQFYPHESALNASFFFHLGTSLDSISNADPNGLSAVRWFGSPEGCGHWIGDCFNDWNGSHQERLGSMIYDQAKFMGYHGRILLYMISLQSGKSPNSMGHGLQTGQVASIDGPFLGFVGWHGSGFAAEEDLVFNDSKTQSVILALILVNKGMACHWFWECGKLNDKASPIRKDPKNTRRRGGFPIHRLQTYPSRLLSDVWLTLGSEQRVNIWRRCSDPRWRAWCFWASAAFCCSLVELKNRSPRFYTAKPPRSGENWDVLDNTKSGGITYPLPSGYLT